MTFDEAIENINVLSAFSTVYGISPTVVQDIISKLKEEYAPTIEMTKLGKNYLLYYLENSSFGSFISDITLARIGTICVKPTDYFEDLSDEDLMQAWLHPETIKVVDK